MLATNLQKLASEKIAEWVSWTSEQWQYWRKNSIYESRPKVAGRTFFFVNILWCSEVYRNSLHLGITQIMLRTAHLSHHVYYLCNTFLLVDSLWSLWRDHMARFCAKYFPKPLVLLSSCSVFVWGFRKIDKSCSPSRIFPSQNISQWKK